MNQSKNLRIRQKKQVVIKLTIFLTLMSLLYLKSEAKQQSKQTLSDSLIAQPFIVKELIN